MALTQRVPFPDTWVTVLLDELIDLPTLGARLTAAGIDATPTRDGCLAVSGDFLGRLDTKPYPSDLLDHPGALAGPTRQHAAIFHISGGGFAVDQPILDVNTEKRLLAGDEPYKTTRFRKVEQLTELLATFPPLGEGFVVPQVGHRFIPWTEWSAGGAGEAFSTFVTLGRTTRMLLTRGMRIFGVPDLGISTAGSTIDAASRSVFAAAFEVAWQGFRPKHPAHLVAYVDRQAGNWQLEPIALDGLWLGGSTSDATEFILRTNIASLMGAYLFDDPNGRPDEVEIAIYGAVDHRFMSTVGLHRVPRKEGPVEVVATMPALSPTVAFALRQVAAVIAEDSNSVQAFHRFAIPSRESHGIAGVVLWPSGNVGLGHGSGTLTCLEAFPATPAEFEQFRAGRQEEWMDAVEAQDAFGQLQDRWSAG